MKKEIKRLELAGPKPLQFLSRISVANDASERLGVNRFLPETEAAIFAVQT
ncbi:MAG: hypothetical protein RIQ71_592 [Verrucomicrobiota bacterium]|jgi:hypothetical protein